MIIKDRNYGKIKIIEPIILELINCPTLQRLKKIDQGGYTKPYWPKNKIINRFEHSVGVYWLLKKFGAALEEQIAGLIHDVSHSAFSHCIDYVLEGGDGKKQNHQDNVFAAFVRRSEIPAILKKHKFNPDYILNDKNFPLQERPLPNLCADRIDYSLRSAIICDHISPALIQKILDSLLIMNNRWVFKNLAIAEKYAELFLWLNKNYWTTLRAAAMHQAVGNYLRHALKLGYISEQDLYTVDQKILKKVSSFHKKDKELFCLFKRANNEIIFKHDPNDYETVIHLKSRVVDPLFLSAGKIKKLSDAIPPWKKVIKNGLGHKTHYLKFAA